MKPRKYSLRQPAAVSVNMEYLINSSAGAFIKRIPHLCICTLSYLNQTIQSLGVRIAKGKKRLLRHLLARSTNNFDLNNTHFTGNPTLEFQLFSNIFGPTLWCLCDKVMQLLFFQNPFFCLFALCWYSILLVPLL